MSSPFKPYEVEVLQLLLAPEFADAALAELLNSAESPHVEYSNVCFYISIKHPKIGKDRRVYSGPPFLSGRWLEHRAWFVVFLEDNELTLEIYPPDEGALPAEFRDVDVQLVHEKGSEMI